MKMRKLTLLVAAAVSSSAVGTIVDGGLNANVGGASVCVAQEAAQNAEKTWTSDDAWAFLKGYQFGDDWKPLLLIEREVEKANQNADSEAQIAAKLAEYLTDDVSYPARQFACMQLRLVGGDAQVPALAALLQSAQDVENARIALESIPGDASGAALRDAMKTATGSTLIGFVNSLAKRGDVAAFPAIVELAKSSDDAAVKRAAVYALGKFGAAGLDALNELNFPVDDAISGQAALAVAADFEKSGDRAAALSIYEKYAAATAQEGCRRAALTGILNASENRSETVVAWFLDADATKVQLAAARLSELSDAQVAQISERQSELSEVGKIAFLELSAEKEGAAVFDKLISELKSDDPVVQATAIRLLGRLGDSRAAKELVPFLAASDKSVATAAAEAMRTFSTDLIGPILLDEVKKAGATATAAGDLLASAKYYDAIDTLVNIGKNGNEAERDAAFSCLAQLADPDEYDVPRLLGMYFVAAQKGWRADAERVLVVVCKKAPADADVLVLNAVDKCGVGASDARTVALLPLLGKLGGDAAFRQIDDAMKSANPRIAGAAFRAFCNWPTAEHADRLWSFATDANAAPSTRKTALRAFVRVATLKSDRPAVETLEMLKKAYENAVDADDRKLVLTRAAEARAVETVEWLAERLDAEEVAANAALREAACDSIVKLAHRRELREPNKATFTPILEKVEKTTQNKEIAEAAEKARLGM